MPKKVSSYECNQYFPVSAYRVVHRPTAEVDAQPEITGHRVSITKDVPILRIDHISTKSSLLGMWRSQRLKAVSLTVEK